jgi:hypothetical protein
MVPSGFRSLFQFLPTRVSACIALVAFWPNGQIAKAAPKRKTQLFRNSFRELPPG